MMTVVLNLTLVWIWFSCEKIWNKLNNNFSLSLCLKCFEGDEGFGWLYAQLNIHTKGHSSHLNQWCILHIPYSSKIYKFPLCLFFFVFWLPLLWPWCIYATCFTSTVGCLISSGVIIVLLDMHYNRCSWISPLAWFQNHCCVKVSIRSVSLPLPFLHFLTGCVYVDTELQISECGCHH